MTHTLPPSESPEAPAPIEPEANQKPESGQPGVVPQSWGLGGDRVTQGTKDYIPEVREAARWFWEVCREDGLNARQAAVLINYSETTIFRLFTGKYEGDLLKVAEAINKYRALREVRQSSGRPFVELSWHKPVNDLLDKIQAYHRMGLITGPSFIGKTQAGLKYLQTHNHGKTKYVRLTADAGMQIFWRELAGGCRVSRDQPVVVLRERIMGVAGRTGALDENHLLIIDEFEQVLWTYSERARVRVIEAIREVHDRTRCAIGIFGAPSTERDMEEDRVKEVLRKFGNRCPFRLRLKPAEKLYTPADLQAIASSAGLKPRLAEPDIAECRSILAETNAGLLFDAFEAGRRMSVNKKQPFAFPHVAAAYALIVDKSTK